MQNSDVPTIDFPGMVASRTKKFLFFKRPKGAKIPIGINWKCICAKENVLTEDVDQYCGKCGTRLRQQENKEDTSGYYTLVMITHIVK